MRPPEDNRAGEQVDVLEIVGPIRVADRDVAAGLHIGAGGVVVAGGIGYVLIRQLSQRVLDCPRVEGRILRVASRPDSRWRRDARLAVLTLKDELTTIDSGRRLNIQQHPVVQLVSVQGVVRRCGLVRGLRHEGVVATPRHRLHGACGRRPELRDGRSAVQDRIEVRVEGVRRVRLLGLEARPVADRRHRRRLGRELRVYVRHPLRVVEGRERHPVLQLRVRQKPRDVPRVLPRICGGGLKIEAVDTPVRLVGRVPRRAVVALRGQDVDEAVVYYRRREAADPGIIVVGEHVIGIRPDVCPIQRVVAADLRLFVVGVAEADQDDIVPRGGRGGCR